MDIWDISGLVLSVLGQMLRFHYDFYVCKSFPCLPKAWRLQFQDYYPDLRANNDISELVLGRQDQTVV